MSKAIVGDSAPSYAIQPPLDGTFAWCIYERRGARPEPPPTPLLPPPSSETSSEAPHHE